MAGDGPAVARAGPASSRPGGACMLGVVASERRDTLWHLVAVLGFVGAGAALAARPLRQFDLPWHLAYGRSIAATHKIPHVDDYAYTHTVIHYVGALGDLALYGAQRAAGALGLQLLAGAIAIALALALVAASRPYRATGVLATAIAIAGASAWLFARPATLTFLLVAIVMLLVEAHRRAPDTRRGRAALFGAALLHAPWANIHGGALLGVLLLVAYAACRGAATRWSTRAPAWFPSGDARHAASAAAAAAIAALGTLCQPWGLAYLRGPLEVGRYRAILGEWAATSPHFFVATAPAAGAALAVLLALVALGRSGDTRALPAFDLAVALVALGLATRVRFVPVAIVLLAPIAARRAGALVPDRLPVRLAGAAAALALGPGLLIAQDGPPKVGWDARYFPVDGVAFVERAAPRGRMFNFWPYGGYLIWRLYPRFRVLVDGRIGFVHDADTVLEIVKAEHDAAAFAALRARFHFQWAVCRATEGERDCEPIARSRDWTMVYVDDATAVYVVKSGDNAALAADGYRVLRHLTPPRLALSRAVAGGAVARDLAHDGRLAAAQAPDSARAWFLAACGAIAIRDARALADARARLSRLVPANHPALPLLARAARDAGMP